MTNQNLPDQKVILVTGSSNGIDRLTVETLAQQGHTVYASMRNANGRNAAVRTERLEEYTELAGAPESMIANFEKLNESDDARDLQEVADAISELIATPTGQRPLRTVVGIDFGVTGLNGATGFDRQSGLSMTNLYSLIKKELEP